MVHEEQGKNSRHRFHVGLNREQIVDAATMLTEKSSLLEWSLRDLARELNVVPSVIYHHIGGKDEIARGVVERVCQNLQCPSPQLPWQEWFRELLHTIRPILRRYPGCAKWLLMHGPTFPSITPIIDAGISTLQRAGFGEKTGITYSTLINNAVFLIAINDDRQIHEEDGPKDHATMIRDFTEQTRDSTGVQVLISSMLEPLTSTTQRVNTFQERYYDFVIETTIAGIECLVATECNSL